MSAQQNTSRGFIDSLIAEMTLEEKLGQLNQNRGEWGETGPVAPAFSEDVIRAGQIGSYLSIYGAEITRDLQRIAVEESRLGIPLLFALDVIHGYRTIFPQPLAEAATWDVDLIERAARIAAIEATAAGVHWNFAPVADVSRDPRWGRIVEGPGEDPYLASAMTEARVRGFQGHDLRAKNTLLATAKHFAAYGGAEGGRDYNTVDISENTLHEIYLPPFKAAVDAGARSVMASFNEIAGIPMHSHDGLINGLLREDWGFDGILVSDYTGVLELIQHGVAGSRAEAGMLGLQAGVDIDMVSHIYLRDLSEKIMSGELDEAVVDSAVRRVLQAKWDLGLFEDPYRYSDPERESELILADEHMEAARETAARSLVLLKNNGLLPLSKEIDTLAVIGPLADARRDMLGGWVIVGRTEDASTVLEGIHGAVSPGTTVMYARGAGIEDPDTSGFEEAVEVADQADAVVLVLGEHYNMSAEAHNRTSLDLPGVQRDLAKAIHATGTPVVVVLINGRPLSIPWLDENVAAILEAWFPGTRGGEAIADVLLGDVNPSGKLPVTFPRTVGQVPLYYNHKNTGRPPDPNNKYTSKYIDVPWTPLYPFGYGLSYTTFRFSTVSLSGSTMAWGDTLAVLVDVTNTGERDGREIVQLYMRDEVASVTPVVRELRGFQPVDLAAGETNTVRFHLTIDDLSFYDADTGWTAEPGFFTVYVGSSSDADRSARFEFLNR